MTQKIRTLIILLVGAILVAEFYVYGGVWKAVGFFDYPAREGKILIMEKGQNYGDQHAALDREAGSHLDLLDFNTLMTYVGVVGDHANKATRAVKYGFAKADDQTVPGVGKEPIVAARVFGWQATGREVFTGQVIGCGGAIRHSDLPQNIGCEGTRNLNPALAYYKAWYPQCEMFSLIGKVTDGSGIEHVICINNKVVTEWDGTLELAVNLPYINSINQPDTTMGERKMSGAFSYWLVSDPYDPTLAQPAPIPTTRATRPTTQQEEHRLRPHTPQIESETETILRPNQPATYKVSPTR